MDLREEYENGKENSDDVGKHEFFMKQALLMGERALEVGETPVGCVLVLDGKIIGSGMNDTNRSMNGTRHAEFLAIEEALQTYPQSIFSKVDLYVTVEPCVMCASLLRQYRIRQVYFGCANDRFGGNGSVLSLHSDSSVDPPYPAHQGIFPKEAIMLLRRFYIQENTNAPNPRPKRNRELNMDFSDEG
ncbi:cytidine and deoxycytidylate deaminase zinc-binding domain protein [Talaromyces proteolyticus]|uniref:tRNA(adenine(34)) deaminase n=1 Tax=Talaromyces proteolyticus TaxID=1131652 RepID=A0AAD4KID3_9EURO|nr:cytidine and deoxycytidylate deaminase zinc-binding domain protein [Talaromyces proteolyticus]KAH8690979.1 cytidine and deoxycytidylate deaminase zinc-binding domain protein [Talaromyces proteolyticus]